ncbi:hypothetical protein GCM10027295_32790 [Pseudaeromonas pectinilytica]
MYAIQSVGLLHCFFCPVLISAAHCGTYSSAVIDLERSIFSWSVYYWVDAMHCLVSIGHVAMFTGSGQ